MISQRPAAAADRAVPGHREGDIIIPGLGGAAIGTPVAREYMAAATAMGRPRAKNGPAPAGYGAEAVRGAITRPITTSPERLRRSPTRDRGAEMARHDHLRVDTGPRVYCCAPHGPWQRGTNENTNGLLRPYFPKGTDLGVHSADDLVAVAAVLNAQPRKTLGWRTPAESLDQVLRSVHTGRVATTA